MQPLKPGTSRHHLFTRPEIRAKLVQIYGEPSTLEDSEWLAREVDRVHRHIPIYPIDQQLHRDIHKQPKKGNGDHKDSSANQHVTCLV